MGSYRTKKLGPLGGPAPPRETLTLSRPASPNCCPAGSLSARVPTSSKSTGPTCREAASAAALAGTRRRRTTASRGLRAVGEKPVLRVWRRFTPHVVKVRVAGTFPSAGSWRLGLTSTTVLTGFCFLTQGLGSPGYPRATHLPNLATTAQVPLCPAWLYFLMSCLYGIVFLRAAPFSP